MGQLCGGKVAGTFPTTTNYQHIDGKGCALLFVQVTADREVIHDIVLTVEREEKLPLGLAPVGNLARIGLLGQRAANNQHGIAIVLKGFQRVHHNGMVNLARGEVAKRPLLPVHLTKRRVHHHRIKRFWRKRHDSRVVLSWIKALHAQGFKAVVLNLVDRGGGWVGLHHQCAVARRGFANLLLWRDTRQTACHKRQWNRRAVRLIAQAHRVAHIQAGLRFVQVFQPLVDHLVAAPLLARRLHNVAGGNDHAQFNRLVCPLGLI